ncbi:MAG: glycerophosphoryl diester phosphodiesterase membrane domain-containing protein [Pseudomonadota bacterium]
MEFKIGDVANRTIGAVSRNFAVFSLLSLVLVGVPTFVITVSQMGVASGDPSAFGIAAVIALIVNFATAYILQGAIIHGAVVDFNGARASFGDCLSTGLKNALPLVAIAILMGLGLMLGLLLLVVPGVILLVMWIVAVPVQVVENSGITESFGRSQELTKGNRWKIFGLVVVYFILAVVLSMIVMLPAGLVGATGEGTLIVALFQVVSTVLSAVVSATGVSAVYYELRKAKEGVGAEALAQVFE